MSKVIRMHEWYGEKEVLEKLKGLTVDSAELIEVDNLGNTMNMISLVLKDQSTGQKTYLGFDDGLWTVGGEQLREVDIHDFAYELSCKLRDELHGCLVEYGCEDAIKELDPIESVFNDVVDEFLNDRLRK